MLFAALVVPVLAAQQAEAATVDNSCDLQVTTETASNPTGATHTLVATLSNPDVAPCADTDYEVDFEVESGPAVTFNATTTSTTTGASDDGNTTTTPDATCTILGTPPGDNAGTPEVNEATSCTVQFTSAVAGTNIVRAWVDDDKDNSTFDADALEGRDEATTPGNRTEVDDTDVVAKTWFTAAPTNLKIDCDDESGDDTQVNPAGQSETYTCHAFSDTNANSTQDLGEPDSAGIVIDAENLAGANDPDNSAATGTADFNDACTTDADGDCTFILTAAEAEIGSANVCFWADVNGDNVFSTAAGIYDGFNCSEAVGAAENDNETDKVTKTWAAVGVTPAVLDASPEVDNNPSGSTHPMSATVVDQFGTPVPNVLVDFDVEAGRNVAQATVCNDVLTNASGVANCTYTDAGTAITSGSDTINVYVSGSQDAGEARETEDTDLSDTLVKFWTAGGPPAAASTVIDMDGTGASGGAADCSDDAVGTPTAVGATHLVCGDVLSSVPAGIPGAEATFTTDLGFFTNADGDDLGQSLATTADENGEAFALLSSEDAGTATVTLTSGSASDSGTVAFTALEARNLDCEPETATNPTGTSQVINCTSTDRFGNPTAEAGTADTLTLSETGAGRFTTASPVALGADGTTEVIVSTTDGEEGTQTISAEFTDDVGDSDVFASDSDDVCDQPADDGDGAGAGPADPGAPAGNCEETVEVVWSDAQPEPTVHARTLTLNKLRHVRDGGKRKLFVKGNLSADDGFAGCEVAEEVKLQRKVAGSWFTQKTDTTGTAGNAKFLVRDRTGKYRLRANESTDGTDTCGRATSNVKRHRHNKKAAAKYYR